jgi:hypothetical protein
LESFGICIEHLSVGGTGQIPEVLTPVRCIPIPTVTRANNVDGTLLVWEETGVRYVKAIDIESFHDQLSANIPGSIRCTAKVRPSWNQLLARMLRRKSGNVPVRQERGAYITTCGRVLRPAVHFHSSTTSVVCQLVTPDGTRHNGVAQHRASRKRRTSKY